MKLVILAMIGAGSLGDEVDWNQWRGAARDGSVAEGWAPEEWPQSLHRDWSIETGRGHASPVIAGANAYSFTWSEGQDRTAAIDLKTGETRWSHEEASDFVVNEYAKDHGKWPRATSLVADGRLFTLGMAGNLVCRELTKGETLWAHRPQPPLEAGKLYCGSSASPLPMGDAVVVQLGDDRGGSVTALEAASGEIRWTTKMEGPGYASPVLIENGGEMQLVTLTEKRVVGLCAADGALRWAFDFPDRWNENIVTPLSAGGHVVVAGVRRGSFALDPRPGESEWTVELAWSQREVPFYMSTPLNWGDWIVGYSNRRRGHIVALDPASGEVEAELDGGWGDHATLLRSDDVLLVQGTDGSLRVIRREGEGMKVHRSYEVAETETWSHPVPVSGGFLIQEVGRLTRWSFAAPE